MKILFKKHSDNRKIGRDTAFTYMPRSTCPDSCELKNGSCYAEGWPVVLHWNSLDNPERNTGENYYSWDDLILQLKALPKGKLFRGSIAGDQVGENDDIDLCRLQEMSDACARIHGFSYSHKAVGFGTFGESYRMQQTRASNSIAIKETNSKASKNGYGLVINLSANSLQKADYLYTLGIGPVVCVVPMDAPKHFKTPEGRHVITCPNEYLEDMTCDKCKLCAKPDRKSIIAFRAHGTKRTKLSAKLKVEYTDKRVHLNVVN